jgi:hypothetical protein
MGDLVSVGKAAREIAVRFPQIFAVVHNAGALLNSREVSPQGTEQTIASHVLGPHLFTTVLLPNLIATQGRVVTVSSGGMYSAELPNVDGKRTLEMRVDSYNGSKQYAIAKRAQVTLNEIWATKERSVHFDSMHPGWADTPGVQESIPAFQRITKPILRSPEQGADTIAWLAANGSHNLWIIRTVFFIEHLAYGAGFCALILAMMKVASGPSAALRYAILSTFSLLAVYLPGLWAGYLSDKLGYAHYFLFALSLAIPGILSAWWAKRHFEEA